MKNNTNKESSKTGRRNHQTIKFFLALKTALVPGDWKVINMMSNCKVMFREQENNEIKLPYQVNWLKL